MSINAIIAYLESLGGVLTYRPGPGDGSPEIAWGDVFFYYAPDGTLPTTGQPFATIVTKDYPGDDASDLNRPGAFRLNIGVDKDTFAGWTDNDPRHNAAAGTDPRTPDTVFAHPVYGSAGWLAVVNPGARTEKPIRELLRTAHHRARARHQRRTGSR